MNLIMQLIVAVIILLNIIFVTGHKCGSKPINCKNYKFEEHYRDLKCRPIYSKKDPCPICYDCPVLSLMSQTSDKCYYHDQVFNIGETVEEIEGNPCTASCSCAQDFDDSQSTTFICAILDCARPPDDCRAEFSLDSCCPVNYDCDDPTTSEHTCTKEGVTYLTGERFILKSNPCVKCLCDNNGRVQCKQISCDLQIQYSNYLKQYCAPIYYGESNCCPLGFLCPGDGVTIINKPSMNSNTDKMCKFGKSSLQIGSKITVKDRPCLKCECTIPPLVTCYEDPGCQP